MNKAKTTYRNIIKVTSIFGAVQVLQIFISLVRTKFAAIFIGAAGMGILGLFTSSFNVIYFIAGLGLNFSATREIAQFTHENDHPAANKAYSIARKYVTYMSIAAMILVVVFSQQLSQYTFGNTHYTLGFILLSITILLKSITNINTAVLQGLRRIREMVKSSFFGALLGLFTCIPLYYFFKEDGIVPGMVLTVILSFLVSYYFIRKTSITNTRIGLKDAISGGAFMVKLGMVMMAGAIVGSAITYLINIFIVRNGSVADLGLYNAGVGLSSQYVSLVFTALSVDFFPKLSTVNTDNKKVSEMVNQQAEITFLILLPILVTMILTSPILIKVLLTNEFDRISNFARITALFTAFQAAAYTLSNIPLAKGDKKIFFVWNSLFPGCCALLFFTFGYYFFGLNGLALGIGLVNVAHFTGIAIVCARRYGYRMNKNSLYFFAVIIVMTGATFLAVSLWPNVIGYIIGCILLILSVFFSVFYLHKCMDLRELLSQFLGMFKKAKALA